MTRIWDLWNHINVCLIPRRTSVLAGMKGVTHLLWKNLVCNWEVDTIKKMCAHNSGGDVNMVNYFLVLVRQFLSSRDNIHHPTPLLKFYTTLTLKWFHYTWLVLYISKLSQVSLIIKESFIDFMKEVHLLILQLY